MNAPTPEAGATSYQLAWPIASGLRGAIPVRRGSARMTRATACSGVVTGTGRGGGVGEGSVDAAAQPAPRSARTSRSAARIVIVVGTAAGRMRFRRLASAMRSRLEAAPVARLELEGRVLDVEVA